MKMRVIVIEVLQLKADLIQSREGPSVRLGRVRTAKSFCLQDLLCWIYRLQPLVIWMRDLKQQRCQISQLNEKMNSNYEMQAEILNFRTQVWPNQVPARNYQSQKAKTIESSKPQTQNQKGQTSPSFMKNLNHQSSLRTIGLRIRYNQTMQISWRRSIWRKLM